MYEVTFVRDVHHPGVEELEIAGITLVKGRPTPVSDFITRQIRGHPQVGRDYIITFTRISAQRKAEKKTEQREDKT